MSTEVRPAATSSPQPAEGKVTQIIVYGHSALFYWWPLWAAGYFMALLTWLHHDQAVIGNNPEWFYPNRDLGVVYTLLLLLLITLTSTKIKGIKAALIIAVLSFFALLFVYLGWIAAMLGWLGHQSISLSLGFYLFSSSYLLLVWLITVFGTDRLSYWRFRPGHVSFEYLGGVVNNSYDTDNITISLNRENDFFRHWIIGLGSGDLHIQTMGGRGEQLEMANVLFVGTKMADIQRLAATKPDVPQQA